MSEMFFIPDFGITQAVHILKQVRHLPNQPHTRNVVVAGLPHSHRRGCIARVAGFAHKRQEPEIRNSVGVLHPSLSSTAMEDAAVLDVRGTTRTLQMFRTPLTLSPQITDEESALKLVLCESIKVPSLSPILLADYILFHLNKNPKLVHVYGPMNMEPTNDISEFLEQFGAKHSCLGPGKVVNHEFAARQFIRFWKQEKYAPFIFDNVPKFTEQFCNAMLKKYGVQSINEAWKLKRKQLTDVDVELTNSEKQALRQSL